MRVKIGPYVNWVGPYQIAAKLLFWKDEHKDDIVNDFGAWLANKKDGSDSYFAKACQWIHDKKKRKISIKLDSYDTWSMDHTLALIVLPMLKQLQKDKHGSPYVEFDDVPESMRYTETEEYDSQYTFDFYQEATDKAACDIHSRWNWVLSEIIWAFEQIVNDDWEDQYYITNPDAKGIGEYFKSVDRIGRDAHQARIENGLRLFGVYYQGLWD